MGRLDGKTALITAAGAGIGRASAIAFARENARVIATDIDPVALQTLADTANIETHLLDVTDSAAIADLIESQPDLDILF
ncbi:MAG TPA: SDR family NAD(P)-dependent oxidoreductase, partial [Henriciella marina]|nr:SDR family NAD(P)-dependent oxidoreductase [Henriciella marina]